MPPKVRLAKIILYLLLIITIGFIVVGFILDPVSMSLFILAVIGFFGLFWSALVLGEWINEN